MESHLDRILARIAFLLTTNFSSPPPSPVTQPRYCRVKGAKETESAWILFVQDDITGQSLVIKVLRPINDSRYGDMRDISRRHECQLEALHWNTLFTPDIYIGLASVLGLDSAQRRLILGEIIEQVAQSERLVVGAEYGLVMHPLPQNRRVDHLLWRTTAERYRDYMPRIYHLLHIFTEYIRQVHLDKVPVVEILERKNVDDVTNVKRKKTLLIKGTDAVVKEASYGSPVQVEAKLSAILKDAHPTLEKIKKHCNTTKEYDSWRTILEEIYEKLPQIVELNLYQKYFEQRVKGGYIRRCHGDLKTSNIWILGTETGSTPPITQAVQVLDTIDFNSSYCNIDILSDFAMLAVDIQVHTRSSFIVYAFIEEYLATTRQQDAVARAVLRYYLVEKTLVSAFVSILYDNEYHLGLRFLHVAEVHLNELKQFIDDEKQMPSFHRNDPEFWIEI